MAAKVEVRLALKILIFAPLVKNSYNVWGEKRKVKVLL